MPNDWTWAKDPRRHCLNVNPNVFFPTIKSSRANARTLYQLNRTAKALCEGCPVKGPCFRHAMDNHEEGVWGGTTYEERERMKCQR